MKILSGILTVILLMAVLPVSAQRSGVPVRNADSDEAVELSVEFVMPNGDVYERQPFPVFVTLKSTSPDIASANILSDFHLKKGEFSTFQTIENPGAAYTRREGKKMYYYFPLKAYMVSFTDKGTYEFTGGEYSIGIAYPVMVNDPFWGPVRSQQVKERNVSAASAKIKVKSLPDIVPGETFSGSVGKFSIETIVPKGDIFIDEDAVAYVVLRGRGMIESATLPQYKNAFTHGMKLKSVSESREESFDHETNEMVSEIHLECIFVPSEMDSVEIGEITFDYFDPDSKQYKTARSEPVKVTIKSSASKKESIEI